MKGTPNERFDAKIKKNKSGCWEWIAYCNPAGYGRFTANGASMQAHRFAYERAFQPIPEGKIVCHRCDNPPCVNPNHLFLGTHADNVADMINKGRSVVNKGEKHGRSKLTASAVLAIRGLDGSLPQADIAVLYGVSPSLIQKVISRELWPHVPPPTIITPQ